MPNGLQGALASLAALHQSLVATRTPEHNNEINILFIKKTAVQWQWKTQDACKEGGIGLTELFQGIMAKVQREAAIQNLILSYILQKFRTKAEILQKIAGGGIFKHTQHSFQMSTIHCLAFTILWLKLLHRIAIYCNLRELGLGRRLSRCCDQLRRRWNILAWLTTQHDLGGSTGVSTYTSTTASVRLRFPRP